MICSQECSNNAEYVCYCQPSMAFYVCSQHLNTHLSSSRVTHPINPIRSTLDQRLKECLSKAIAERIQVVTFVEEKFKNCVINLENALKVETKKYEKLFENQKNSLQNLNEILEDSLTLQEKSEIIQNLLPNWSFEEPSINPNKILGEFRKILQGYKIVENQTIQKTSNLLLFLNFTDPYCFLGPPMRNIIYDTPASLIPMNSSEILCILGLNEKNCISSIKECYLSTPCHSVNSVIKTGPILAKTYTFSISLKYSENSSNNVNFKARVIEPNNVEILSTRVKNLLYDWKRLILTFKVGSATENCRIQFGIETKSPFSRISSFLFDKIQLEQSSRASPFAKSLRVHDEILKNLVDNRFIQGGILELENDLPYIDNNQSINCNLNLDSPNFSVIAVAAWENINKAAVFAFSNNLNENPNIKVFINNNRINVEIQAAVGAIREELVVNANINLISMKVYHFAVIHLNKSVTVYLDGRECGQVNYNSILPVLKCVGVLRKEMYGTGDKIYGKNFKVFNRELLENEIMDDYEFARCMFV